MKKLCLFLLILIIGCTEHEEIFLTENQDIYVEEGFLTFPDNEAFENLIIKKKIQSAMERQEWENSMGFQSMNSFYEDAMKRENEYYSSLIKNGEKFDNSCTTHSPYIQSNAKYFVFDDEGDISPNTCRLSAATLVNKDGFVRIGDVLYQYTWDQFKSFQLNGSIEVKEAKKLLSQADQLNAKFENDDYFITYDNVVVNKVKNIKIPQDENKRNSYYESCKDGDFMYKIHGEVHFRYYTVNTYNWYPCGSIECEEPDMCAKMPCNLNDPNCARFQCQGIANTYYRSIYEVEAVTKTSGFPHEDPKRIYVRYTVNNVEKVVEFSGSQTYLRGTVFEATGYRPVYVSTATNSFVDLVGYNACALNW